jgi:hypothetical protein
LEGILFRVSGSGVDGEVIPLTVGASPTYETVQISLSLDDLFSRPLALVGNTGSGKSWSVATLIQSCLATLQQKGEYRPKFIVLDINGEYGTAFRTPVGDRRPNEVLVNGRSFSLPLWVFQFSEFVHYFGATAAAAAQQPVLERAVTIARQEHAVAKGGVQDEDSAALLKRKEKTELVLEALRVLRTLTYASTGSKGVGEMARDYYTIVDIALGTAAFTEGLGEDDLLAQMQALRDDDALRAMRTWGTFDNKYVLPLQCHDPLRKLCDIAEPLVDAKRIALDEALGLSGVTADTPHPFDPHLLDRGEVFERAISGMRGEERIRDYLATLRLRIRRMLQDRRWQVFYREWDVSLASILGALIGEVRAEDHQDVTVIDCSMLANDVLPFFCAVIGRLLLDVREAGALGQRVAQPWVLVLEEAHNYLRPRRENESSGTTLAREAFERIAKEGRKFGLSLLIASQRPSDVSETALSQCANFIVHRIQNPDDIDYFRRILPAGSREILDQVAILVPGEALLVGSAVNVPSRVRMWPPTRAPHSETPKPSIHWLKQNPFNHLAAIDNLVGVSGGGTEAQQLESESNESVVPAKEEREPAAERGVEQASEP